MTYQELLDDENWKRRRKEIIIRDRLMCTNCGNNILKQHYLETLGVRVSNNLENAVYLVRNPSLNSGLVKTILRQKDCWQDITPSFFKYLVFYIPKKSIEPSNDIINNVAVRRLHLGEYTIKNDNLESFSFFKTMPNTLEWKSNHILHVHHKYYKLGKLPWEYPDEGLTTLCWSCHENFHNTSKVPLLDNKGRRITLTPCQRCNGAGEFPQYSHVIHGKCFDCKGARYEEFKDSIFFKS